MMGDELVSREVMMKVFSEAFEQCSVAPFF